jgi:NAD(P)-dependent dehydrogenase (short-subunit alcohol dehydrogenase family)
MKHVLVTGATGNLGKAVTEKFLKEGHRVTALISPNSDPGFINHPLLKVYAADLANEAAAESVIRKASDGGEALDMGILTVGGFGMGRLLDTSMEALEKYYNLNFLTAYNSARSLFRLMVQQEHGGQLVFIGAKQAYETKGAARMVAYSLSKSLIIKLAQLINEEGEEKGVTASVIVPGTIDTPQNRGAMPDADRSGWVSPDQIAENIHHLITPAGKQLRKVVMKVYGNS